MADDEPEPDGGFEPDVLPVWLVPLVDPDGGTELLDGGTSVDEEPTPSEELLDIKYSQCDQRKSTVKLCLKLPRAGLKFEMQPKIDIA